MKMLLKSKFFLKTRRHLNLRKNLNNKFIAFFEETPTTSPKSVRNRLKVNNSVSRTLKSSEIPLSIAKDFFTS